MLNSEYANNILKTVYMDYLDARLKSENNLDITISVNNGVLSIANYMKDEVYNIDLKTGKKASAKKLAKISNASKSNSK